MSGAFHERRCDAEALAVNADAGHCFLMRVKASPVGTGNQAACGAPTLAQLAELGLQQRCRHCTSADRRVCGSS
ncbi:MAG: hypothetical protein JSV19_11390 [Phycisphaerales bacterium]|nr:MAG: hypothetical protein JSV19_11390 [Phycisphaerales bacterium]